MRAEQKPHRLMGSPLINRFDHYLQRRGWILSYFPNRYHERIVTVRRYVCDTGRPDFLAVNYLTVLIAERDTQSYARRIVAAIEQLADNVGERAISGTMVRL
jgi:hypothetical protein